MQKLWLICVGITCVAFLAMYALLSFYSQANEEPVSFVLHTFEGNDYASSKDPQFKLVFFGFTHCPDVCPTGLATMGKALSSDQALSETVTPVFITVDPERDTPEAMRDYLQNFEPSFIGLVGSRAELETVQKAFKVYAQKVQPPRYEEYLMDHSTHIYLLDKDDMVVDVYDYRIDATKMAQKIQSHI